MRPLLQISAAYIIKSPALSADSDVTFYCRYSFKESGESAAVGGKKAKVCNLEEEFGFEEFDRAEYDDWKRRMLNAAGLIET